VSTNRRKIGPGAASQPPLRHARRRCEHRFRAGYRSAGRVSLYSRRQRRHVSGASLDDAPVCRFCHGSRLESPVSLSHGARRHRPERRFRPADTNRVRLGPSAGLGGSRTSRRGDRLDRRHGRAPPRDSTRPGVDIDDDQRDSDHSVSAVCGGRETARDGARGAVGHRAE
jgi:hypothetical protein